MARTRFVSSTDMLHTTTTIRVDGRGNLVRHEAANRNVFHLLKFYFRKVAILFLKPSHIDVLDDYIK